MTAIQKVLLVAGCAWGSVVCVLFLLKGLNDGFDPIGFLLVWAIPTVLVWWPTGVLKHVVAWFNKE